MNNAELIAYFRETNPHHAGLSDDYILQSYADKARTEGWIEDFPELKEYWRQGQRAAAGSLLAESGRGLAAGAFGDVPATMWGAAAAVTDSFARTRQALIDNTIGRPVEGDEGFLNTWRQRLLEDSESVENLRSNFQERAAENVQQAQDLRGVVSVESFDDIESVSDALRWALPGVARAVPSIAPIVASSVVSGGIAGAGLTGAARVAAMSGAAAAAGGATGVAQNVGATYNDLISRPDVDPGVALGTALVAGTAMGLLDAASAMVPAAKLSGAFRGAAQDTVLNSVAKVLNKSPLKAWAEAGGVRGVTAGAAEGILGEGITESLQEIIAIAGEEYATGREVPADEVWSRIRDSGIIGGLTGGLVTGSLGFAGSERRTTETAVDVEATKKPYDFANLTGRVEPIEPEEAVAPPATTGPRFMEGDLVNALGPSNVPAAIGLEIVGMAREGDMNVYQVRQAGVPDGEVTPVPENQLRVYNPDGSVEIRFREREKRLAEDAVKRAALTERDIEELKGLGLTDDDIAIQSAGDLYNRLAENRRKDREARAVARAVPKETWYTNEDGNLVYQAPPEQGIQGSVFGGVPQTAERGVPPTELPPFAQPSQTVAQERSNEIRSESAQRLQDQVEDPNQMVFPTLPEARTPVTPNVFETVEEDAMAAEADTILDDTYRQFKTQLRELAKIERSVLRLRDPEITNEDVDGRIAYYQQQVEAVKLGEDITPLIEAKRQEEQVLKKLARLKGLATKTLQREERKELREKDRAESTLTKITGILQKASMPLDQAQARAKEIFSADVNTQENLKRARAEATAWRTNNGAVAAAPTPTEVTPETAVQDRPALTGIASVVPTNRPIVSSTDNAWKAFTRGWSRPRKNAAGKTVAGNMTDSRRAVAIQNPDGTVDVRVIYPHAGQWRMVMVPNHRIDAAEAISQIQAALKSSGVNISNATVERALNPKTADRVARKTRNAIDEANKNVGWAPAETQPIFGHNRLLNNGQIIALMKSPDNEPFPWGSRHYSNLAAYQQAENEGISAAQAAGMYAAVSTLPVAPQESGIDQQTLNPREALEALEQQETSAEAASVVESTPAPVPAVAPVQPGDPLALSTKDAAHAYVRALSKSPTQEALNAIPKMADKIKGKNVIAVPGNILEELAKGEFKTALKYAKSLVGIFEKHLPTLGADLRARIDAVSVEDPDATAVENLAIPTAAIVSQVVSLGNLVRSRSAGDVENTLNRISPGASFRPGGVATKHFFDLLVRSARRLGINVVIYKLDREGAGFFAQEGGSYNPSTRTIQLVIADIANPSLDSVTTVLHELIHDQIRDQPYYIREAFHTAFNEAVNNTIALFHNADADPRLRDGVRPADMDEATWLEENFVESAALVAVKQEFARGVFATAMRRMRELYLRAKAWVINATGATVSPELARDLLEVRLKRFISGDFDSDGVFNAIARAKNSILWKIQSHLPGVSQMTDTDMNIRQPLWEYKEYEMAQEEHDLLYRRGVEDKTIENARETRKAAAIYRAKYTIAAANQFNYDLTDEYNLKRQDGSLAKDYTYDQYIRDLGIDDPRETQKQAVASLTETLGSEPIPFDIKLGIKELTSTSEMDQAYDHYSDYVRKGQLNVTRKANELRNNAAALRVQLETRIQQYAKLKNKFNSAEEIDKQIRSWVIPQLDKLKKDLERASEADSNRGAAIAELEALEDLTGDWESGVLVTEHYRRLLNRLKIDDVPLYSIMRTLSEVDDEVFHRPADEIKSHLRQLAETNDSIDALFLDNGRASPLLPALIAFRKTQEHVVDSTRFAQLSAEAKVDTMNRISAIMNATNQQAVEQIRADLRELRGTRGYRLIQRYLNLKDKILREQRQMERVSFRAQVLRGSTKAFENIAARVDQALNRSNLFELIDGEPIFVPNDPGVIDAQALDVNARHIFRLETTSDQTLRSWVAKQTAWLDARPLLEQHNRVYNTILKQRDEIRDYLIRGPANNAGSVGGGRFESFKAMMFGTRTQAGRRNGALFNTYEALKRAFSGNDTTYGHRWSRELRDLARATGLGRKQSFADLWFYQPMMHIINTLEVDAESQFNHVLTQIRLNPDAGARLAKPGAVDALRRLFNISVKNSDWTYEKIQKGGLQVVEDELGAPTELGGLPSGTVRRQLQRGTRTVPVRPADTVLSIAEGMRRRFAELALSPDSFVETETNPGKSVQFWVSLPLPRLEEIRAELKSWFTPLVVTHFIEPLVFNFVNPQLYTPKVDGKASTVVDPSIVVDAWERSGNDVLQFADNLAAAVPGGYSEAQWRHEVVGFFNKYYIKLDKMLTSAQRTKEKSLGGVPHIAMDSRRAFDFPAEWLTYLPFSADINAMMSNTIAANAAFGRDLRRLSSGITVMHNELKHREKQLNTARISYAGNSDRQIAKLLEAHGFNGEPVENGAAWIAERERAETALRHIDPNKTMNLVRGMLSPNSGVAADMGILFDIFSLAVSALLATPKTAIKNIQAIIDTVTYFGGPSTQGLKALSRGSKNLIQNVIYSSAALFGFDPGAGNLDNVRLARVGQLDSTQSLTFQDRASQAGRNYNLERGFFPRMQWMVRVLRDVLADTTLTRRGQTFTTIAPRLPTGIFTAGTLATNAAANTGILTSYADVIRRAADLFRKNPSRLAAIQNGGQLTAKELGWSDGWFLKDEAAFNRLRNHAEEAGVILEDMVLEGLTRESQNQDVLSDKTIRAIVERSISEVVREGSTVTRPPDLLTTAFGRATMTLTGWQYSKSWQLWNIAKHPEKGFTVGSVLGAAALLGLVMLPLNMMFAWLLAEYDEELLGKAANMRDIRLSDDAGSILLAVNERAALTGAFGGFSDVINSVFSQWGPNSEPVSIEDKIVYLSLIRGLFNATSRWAAVGSEANWATVGRQMFQSVGGGGPLQYIQMMNRAGDWTGVGPIFKTEAGITARTNVNNLIDVAAREMKFELRGRTSSGTYRPSRATPHITTMHLAALTGDRESFMTARQRAIEMYREDGRPDPIKAVKDAFSARHPLKGRFKTPPTVAEARMLLQRMNEEDRAVTLEALNSFNRFGNILGINPYWGVSSRQLPMTEERRELADFRRQMLED